MIQKSEIRLPQIFLRHIGILKSIYIRSLSLFKRLLFFYIFISREAREQHPRRYSGLSPHHLSRDTLITSCKHMTSAVSHPNPLRSSTLAACTFILCECPYLPEINTDLLAFALILVLSEWVLPVELPISYCLPCFDPLKELLLAIVHGLW